MCDKSRAVCKTLGFAIVIFVLSLGFQGQALGELLSINASGNITDIYAEDTSGNDISADFESFLPFSTGSDFTATMLYDLSLSDQDSDPNRGIYDQPTTGNYFTWNIDGTTGTTFSEKNSLDVRVFDDSSASHDSLGVIGALDLPDDWWTNVSLRMIAKFMDFDETAWNSDALPNGLNPDDFDDEWDEKTIKISRRSSLGDGRIDRPGKDTLRFQDLSIEGEITSFSTSRIDNAPNPIPEPCSVLLLGTGLAGFAGTRIRKRFKK